MGIDQEGSGGGDGDSDEEVKVEPVDGKKKSLQMTIRILRFLQLLCEGHFSELQNHLRE
jgi:hypothetical protein